MARHSLGGLRTKTSLNSRLKPLNSQATNHVRSNANKNRFRGSRMQPSGHFCVESSDAAIASKDEHTKTVAPREENVKDVLVLIEGSLQRVIMAVHNNVPPGGASNAFCLSRRILEEAKCVAAAGQIPLVRVGRPRKQNVLPHCGRFD